jgi:hypothetical protein
MLITELYKTKHDLAQWQTNANIQFTKRVIDTYNYHKLWTPRQRVQDKWAGFVVVRLNRFVGNKPLLLRNLMALKFSRWNMRTVR